MREEDIISIGDVVRFQAQQQPDAVVFTFEGDEMTYAALDAWSARPSWAR